LDKDVKKLGISNRKVALLEKCVDMLEKGKEVPMAQGILARYTTEKFTTAAEWRTWLNTNKKNLFYTEAGGFKFMVNTYGKPLAVNNETTQVTEAAAVPTLADPVAVSAKLVYAKDKKTADIIINASLLKGWHIYALVPSDSPFIPTETKLELPEGVVVPKDWQTSAALPFPGSEGVFVFEDKVSFKTTVDCSMAKPGELIKCGIFYQTCNDDKCLQPMTKMVELHF